MIIEKRRQSNLLIWQGHGILIKDVHDNINPCPYDHRVYYIIWYNRIGKCKLGEFYIPRLKKYVIIYW